MRCNICLPAKPIALFILLRIIGRIVEERFRLYLDTHFFEHHHGHFIELVILNGRCESFFIRNALQQILEKIEEYFALVKGNGYYDRKRREQARYWMYESINESLKNSFYENPTIEKLMTDYETAVLEGKLESFIAAGELLERYRNLSK